MLSMGTLSHGGIMVNYQCNSACRHCLYSCSPSRRPGYVDENTAETICDLLRKGGCGAVHIGGGEPFLDFEGLMMVMRKLRKTGIAIKYIETNAYWVNDNLAQQKIMRLLEDGPNTLCISLDPYHAEYIPYGAPLALAELCEKNGLDYFFWREDFLPLLYRLDKQKAHSRIEMEKVFSREYIFTSAQASGVRYGGRAVNIEREFSPLYPFNSFAAEKTPCHKILSNRHFHVDMFCCFIPPGCTGLRIPLSDIVEGIPDGKYPVFQALYSGGVSALMELALQHGFSPGSPADGYPSKCNLCFHIRRFLSGKEFPELDRNHYEEALRYY